MFYHCLWVAEPSHIFENKDNILADTYLNAYLYIYINVNVFDLI